jgi:membrane associated rhomboid family serine protease
MTLLISLTCLLLKCIHTLMAPPARHALVEAGGALPSNIAVMLVQPLSNWLSTGLLTLASALFIHASWLHLVGNLVYLWVFGIAVERRLGAIGIAFTFMLGGSLSIIIVSLRLPDLATPIIGASGAVSAVVGAYLGLFPSRRIGMFLPLGLYLQFARVPALLVIGSWFTLQLLYSVIGPITGAVAWWTHLAGFVLGLMIALLARALAQIRL